MQRLYLLPRKKSGQHFKDSRIWLEGLKAGMILPAEIPYCAWVRVPPSETLVWHHSHTLFASFSHEKHSFPYKEV